MKRYILGLTIAAFAYVTVTGFSNGGGTNSQMGNRTGAGGSPASCGDATSCHGPNSLDPSIDLYLVEMDGDTVKNSVYSPNADYKIIVYATSQSPRSVFGFQLAAEKFMSTGAGYYVPTSGLKANAIGAYEVIEQIAPLPATNNNRYVKEINWLAPQVGSGQIKFYLSLLAADGNGAPNGDIANNIQRSFNEGAASVADFGEGTKFNLYPNPVREVVHLSIESSERGVYHLNLFSLSGQLIERRDFHVSTKETKIDMNLANYPSGTYFLQVMKDGKQKMLPVVKH